MLYMSVKPGVGGVFHLPHNMGYVGRVHILLIKILRHELWKEKTQCRAFHYSQQFPESL